MEKQEYALKAQEFAEDVALCVIGEYGHYPSRHIDFKLTYRFDSGGEISRFFPSVKIFYVQRSLYLMAEEFFSKEAFPAAESRGETPKKENMDFRVYVPWEDYGRD